MIIFGTRAYSQALAMVTFVCNNCHNPAAQRVLQRVVRFTLFFIPLFPVSRSYSTTCTFCGLTTKINKEQADQYVAYGAQQQASYQQSPVPMDQQGYSQPVQPGYGQPVQPGDGQPVQPGYGQPVQPGYGQPAPDYPTQQYPAQS